MLGGLVSVLLPECPVAGKGYTESPAASFERNYAIHSHEDTTQASTSGHSRSKMDGKSRNSGEIAAGFLLAH
jgi:hypothetical protein